MNTKANFYMMTYDQIEYTEVYSFSSNMVNFLFEMSNASCDFY